jgi:hypothetical protein
MIFYGYGEESRARSGQSRHNHKRIFDGYVYGCHKPGRFKSDLYRTKTSRHNPKNDHGVSFCSARHWGTGGAAGTWREVVPTKEESRYAMGKQPRWTVLEDVASCRASARFSLDSVVGSNQTSASLEARVGAEFQRMMPDAVTGSARAVWSARSGRSVVRRFKVVNAAFLKYRIKWRTVVAARLSGCSVDDVERVSLVLYNGKGTMANAYDVANNWKHEVGPPFAFSDAMSRLESNGCLLDEASGGGGVEEVQATEGSEEERAETGDAMPPASRSSGEKLSRPMGPKQAKRRKINDVNSFEMAAAVASISES